MSSNDEKNNHDGLYDEVGPSDLIEYDDSLDQAEFESSPTSEIISIQEPLCSKGLLSRPAILRAKEEGLLLIDPFEERSLGTNSYDVRLGSHYWEESSDSGITTQICKSPIYNMYDPEHVNRLFVKRRAQKAEDSLFWLCKQQKIKNISPQDEVILLQPGQCILGHTQEFIGGCSGVITTAMAARSTIGRNALEISRCAGAGDHFYCNRWTLEIQNNFQTHAIILVVGRRVGQVWFYETEPLQDPQRVYAKTGKYQTTTDLEEMKRSWKPEDMLPKAYLDWELVKEDDETSETVD
jgi:dCTP deaminase